jgi:hypothetical protein
MATQTVSIIEKTTIIGSGLRCTATHDGTIVIKTNHETITIYIQHFQNSRKIQFDTVNEELNQSPEIFSFYFTGNASSEGVAPEERNDGDEVEPPAQLLEETTAEDDITSEERDLDPKVQTRRKQAKRISSVSETGIDQFCTELSKRLEKKWNVKKLEKSFESLLANPHAFFGCIEITSVYQWSYERLDKSELNSELFHLPFHKVNLFTWWYRELQHATQQYRTRKRLYEVMKPGYTSLTKTERERIRKQIERYMEQGEMLWALVAFVPGLLITVPQVITTEEYASSLSIYQLPLRLPAVKNC